MHVMRDWIGQYTIVVFMFLSISLIIPVYYSSVHCIFRYRYIIPSGMLGYPDQECEGLGLGLAQGLSLSKA